MQALEASRPVRDVARVRKAWPLHRKRRVIDVALDARGRLTDVDGTIARPAESGGEQRQGRVCLHLEPGLCALRRLGVAGLKRKEVDAALLLWAEESLAAPLEDYYIDSWVLSPAARGLAAVPRAPLQRARTQLHEWGYEVVALRVPELRAPRDGRAGVVLWETAGGLVACTWQNRTLLDWQTFPADLPSRALGELLKSKIEVQPDWVLVNYQPSEHPPGAQAHLELDYKHLWPKIDSSEIALADHAGADKWLGPGLAFGFVDEESRQPASTAERLRLGATLLAVAGAAFFWFFAEVTQIEREVEQRQHTTSLLKVQASRSQQIAIRIGSNLAEIRQLRAMTIERDGVLRVLKSVSDVLPPRLRLDSMSIERGGLLALDGVAEAEVDVSRLLEELGLLPMFAQPTLTFTQKDDKQDPPVIRFRIEARLLQPLLILPGNEEDGDEVEVPAASNPAAAPGADAAAPEGDA